MSVDTERVERVALSMLCEPGDTRLAALVDEHGTAEALDRLRRGDGRDPLFRAAAARAAGRDVVQAARRAIETARHHGGRVVIPGDTEWPSQVDDLDELWDETDVHTRAPLCLWVRGPGDLAEALDRSVSVVGSRACSPYGRHMATDLSYELGTAGWGVVSGGAYGIDAAAHRGCLAAGGRTVAVLACGIDRPYPASNLGLFERIAAEGLLVSEWPPGSIPQRHRFLVRNRVIAALTLGTVVVEAALRSGARQTARRALELDRPLMVVPGPVTSETSAGVHQLARGPGEARIVTRASEIIEDLGRIGEDLAPELCGLERPRDALSPVAARVLDAVPRRRAAAAAVIAAQAGVPVADANRTLPDLALRGLVTRRDDRYALADKP